MSDKDDADPAAPDATSDPNVGSSVAPVDDGEADTGGKHALDTSTVEASATPNGESDAGDPDETRRARRKREKATKPKRKAPWWELPALVVLAIGIAILVKSFVVQPFYIPSDSMEKTLHGCPGCHGDRILVNKPIYHFRDPHPGDIVVFDAPKGWDDEPTSKPPSNPVVRAIRGFGQLIGFVPPDGQVLVKRVIATGGQTVKGDSAGHVMVSDTGPNGRFRTLDEPYVYAKSPAQTQFDFGPVTVPKGRLWVMGDHRTDSADSRYHCTPNIPQSTADDNDCDPTSSTVPVDNVIGKAFVIAWPPSRWRTLGTPSTFEAVSATGSALPGALSLSVVLPVLFVRRRSRRRRANRPRSTRGHPGE